jgi:alkanesulfonate monooxygenase SsuD/methylene tetrahydromethanopterin reductase-like flavin-dependent oxidoreductase (luciferase family)
MATIGVSLSTFDPSAAGYPTITAAAVRVEELKFDSLWVGDHLAYRRPILEAVVALSACAAVTRSIDVGFAALVPSLRGAAWTGKQLSSLQVVSGDRLVVGVGVGGEFAAEWSAVGTPRGERAERTDAILSALPQLLSGVAVRVLEGELLREIPPLLPHGVMPRIWVAGRSDAALQRAAQFGDAWLGLWISSERLADIREKLGSFAQRAGRPTPDIAMVVQVVLARTTNEAAVAARSAAAEMYGMSFEQFNKWASVGTPETVAQHLQLLVNAGVTSLVVQPLGAEPFAQYELLAEACEMVRRGGGR